jgi:hypothetical protein
MRRIFKRSSVIFALLFLVIQLIRPVRRNPSTDPAHEFTAVHSATPAVVSMLQRSCSDCHSNQTVWPWYSSVAPASWVIAHDVNDGRDAMNFSQWGAYTLDKQQELVGKMCEEVKDGEMPMSQYTLLHPHARLNSTDVKTLCSWTQQIVGSVEAREDGD